MSEAVQGQPFTWRVRVYQEDVDAGGIVYYANYLRYMERARSEWLRQLELSQSTLLSHDVIFVVRRCNVDYMRPAYLDDELDVVVEVCGTSRVQLELYHKVWRKRRQPEHVLGDQGGNEEIATCNVTIACLSRDSMRPMRIPKQWHAWR